MDLLAAYARVYAAALKANVVMQAHRTGREHRLHANMDIARESGRRCVEDFREMIKEMPEFKEFFDAAAAKPATPSNLAENPEAGKF